MHTFTNVSVRLPEYELCKLLKTFNTKPWHKYLRPGKNLTNVCALPWEFSRQGDIQSRRTYLRCSNYIRRIEYEKELHSVAHHFLLSTFNFKKRFKTAVTHFLISKEVPFSKGESNSFRYARSLSYNHRTLSARKIPCISKTQRIFKFLE